MVVALLAAAVGQVATAPASSAAGGTYTETAGGNANTWTNYTNAGGTQGPTIPGLSSVQIACKLTGFAVANGNTWWYQIASAPWNYSYYVSADAFYNNGATSGSLVGTPWVDPAVPTCGTGSGTSETAGGAANTWSDYTSAGGTQGPTIGGLATVQIACKLAGFRVADGNIWWYQVASAPWNGAFYVSADAFYNNGATSGSLIGTPFVDPAVPDCSTGPTGPSGPGEVAGGLAHTWTDYTNAGGTQGPTIAAGATVQMACKITGFAVANGNTWWYQIAQTPWNNTYYVSADAFYNNGATSGSLVGTPYVDPAVPSCSSGPRPGGETTGGDAHTWANYSHAGGAEGQLIPAHTTVQVTCRVSGFAVANGNTWWYLVASSPWSDVFYVSADAFYNNGATTGPLAGTPYVDPAVPVCVNNHEAPLYGTAIGASRAAVGSSTCRAADPINCASGDFWHSFTDVSVAGRGPSLDLTRTYNDLGATSAGLFGDGWSSTYDEHLTLNQDDGSVTATLSDGSQVTAQPSGSGFVIPPWANSTLVLNGDGTYTLTRGATIVLTFNNSGQLLSLRDLNGYQTTLAYASGHLATVTDAAGRVLHVNVGSNGFASSIVDPLGRTTSYAYDAAGNLASTTNPVGGIWRFTYDVKHQMLTMTDPRNGVVRNAYDDQGKTTSQTDAAGRTTRFAYTGDNFSSLGGTTTVTDARGYAEVKEYANGFLTGLTKAAGTATAARWAYTYDPATFGITSVTDPNGHVTTHTYDTACNLLSTTDPLGRTTTYSYNTFGERLTITDPLGIVTTNVYDARGNLQSSSTPLAGSGQAQTTVLAHGDTSHPGDVTASTDPDHQTTTHGYDAYGNETTTTDPLGHAATAAFDLDSEKTSSADALGDATSFSFTALGDVAAVTDALGHVTTNAYDGDRNLVSVVDPLGHTTTHVYNGDNQLTKTTNPDGSTQQTMYDAAGNAATTIDAGGSRTVNTFDALNRLTSATDPLGHRTSYSYDFVGNRIATTDASGRVSTSAYDAADQLTSVSYAGGGAPGVAFTYDAGGHRLSMVDGTGTTTYQYDTLGRLTSFTNGAGAKVDYGYDLKGQRTSLTYPNAKVVKQGYDAAGNLTSVLDWLGRTTAFAYDATNNLVREVAGSTPTVADTYTYDATNELLSISNAQSASPMQTFTYTRTADAQVASAARSGATTESYSYDTRNQVTKDLQGSYAYNLRGDVTATPTTAAMVYNTNNELTSAGPAATATTYAYDVQNERTAMTPKTGTPATYTYDAAGRMTALTNGVINASYAYNGDGLRMSKTAGATTAAFTWDPTSGTPLLLSDGTTSYLYGPGGLPLEQITGATPQWFHHDQLGSTTLLTGPLGGLNATFSYTSYGKLKSSTGTVKTPLLFAGQYQDTESGFYYLRARYYDPVTAQFTSVDPLVTTTNVTS